MSQMLTARRVGLSGTALKTIALVLMLMDHIHYFFEFTGAIPIWFTMLGRLSAPLFLFCTAEGFAHTHDRKRYFLRMLAVAAPMGALQFFMTYAGWWRRGDGFFPLNGIFMNFVLLCVIWQGMDWLKEKRFVRGTLAILIPLLGWPLAAGRLSVAVPALATPIGLLCYTLLPSWTIITDGGLTYLLEGMILYGFRSKRPVQLGAWAAFVLLAFLVLPMRSGYTFTVLCTEAFEWFSVFAVFLMALYNGQRGAGRKSLFYLIYPGHVYAFYALSCVLYQFLH